MNFSADVLKIDPETLLDSLGGWIRQTVHATLRRKGAVVGVSGGVDSSVCAALCARALGPANVLILLMPERASSSDSLRLGELVGQKLGAPTLIEDIEPILEAAGCYRRQLEAIRRIFPEYGEGWKCKVSLPSILDVDRLNVSQLTVQSPSGELRSEWIRPAAYLQLIAATNFKQRTRTMLEYYHADRLNYAVCGTPNRLEYDQGFFVKGGDGAADFKPIAHLYKTQVFSLARALGIPEEISNRTPTTETFTLAQTQEEFYFTLPYDKMDLCLYGHNHKVPAEDVAPAAGLTATQVLRVYKDIETKRRSTLPLQLPPLLPEPVEEIYQMVESVAHT